MGAQELEIGEFVLIAAIFFLSLDFIQLSRSKNGRSKRKLQTGFYATVVAVGLIVISYAVFFNMFLYDDFSLVEAYSHSSSSLSLLSKLHATWAGAGGSLLLLCFIIALVYFAFRFRRYENPSLHEIATNRILIGILVFFLIMTLMKNPFARFDGIALEGRGLNPSLKSFWMTIHPPIVFVGYAFILLAVALATVNYRVRYELGPSASPEKYQDRFFELMNTPEKEDSEPIPFIEFSKKNLHIQLHNSMLSTLKSLDFEIHQPTPDFNAISVFLGNRYNYWTDDIDHSDYGF